MIILLKVLPSVYGGLQSMGLPELDMIGQLTQLVRKKINELVNKINEQHIFSKHG